VAEDFTLVDTHFHFVLEYGYNFNTVATLISRAKELNVGAMVNISDHPQLFHGGVSLADRFPEIYTALGISPAMIEGWSSKHLEEVKYYLQHPKVIAVGEIGLDYSNNPTPEQRRSQHTLFSKQLDIATGLNLPVIISCSYAFDDLFAILRSKNWGKHMGVVHNFSGNEREAQQLLQAGLYVSYSGLLTRSPRLQKIAQSIPLDKVLLESGCPHTELPYPQRSTFNEPAYVRYTAEFLAKTLDIPIDHLAGVTTENARKLFSIEVRT